MSLCCINVGGSTLCVSVAEEVAPPLLLTSSDLTHLGAFKLPSGTFGESSFAYSVGPIAYNPANNSLFIAGHDHQGTAVAEINIPASLGAGSVYNALPQATVRQNFVILGPRIPSYTLEGTVKVGGLLLVDGDLIGTLYEYYDANANAMDSHFRIAGADLAAGEVTGLFKVGNKGGGWVGGPMCRVPDAWQLQLGAPYLTFNGALSITSRTSFGPAAFGFDPAQLSAATPAVDLLYYTQANPLDAYTEQSEFYNAGTKLNGIAWPDGTDSILFFGRQGIGEVYYGAGTSDPELHGTEIPGEPGVFYWYDPAYSAKGYHAWPYRHQVWAYDASELAAVKAGTIQPWQVQPYAVWELPLPFTIAAADLGGAAWDVANRKLYVMQKEVSAGMPVIHCFGVN